MTFADLARAIWIPILAAACGGPGPSGAPSSPGGGAGARGPADPAPNVLPVSVDGPGCGVGAYLDEPCVSVTICAPGTARCQTVDGLLLDTGSTGLRVFSQALTLELPAVTAGGGPVAECIGYADGSSDWGPVVRAGVVLGGEPAVTVPIQLIDASYADRPASCQSPELDPAAAGFNGILGVGAFGEDCGEGCSRADNGLYFACGAGCAGTALPLASQVQNPVAALPVDGNGLVVRLPSVPPAGAASASGQLVLGIGTRGNNVPPPSVLAYPLDGVGDFRTGLVGATVPAFADTGSNGLFFAPPAGSGLVACAAPDAAWFCPPSAVTLTATMTGAGGSPSTAVTFRIAVADALPAGVQVSAEVGGPTPVPGEFDWGLPFFLGRDVYLGLDGRTSVLGPGPLLAW